jgi:hypothetical protein
MRYIAGWPAFNITPDVAEKLTTISPATIDRYLKKDRDALRLKGKSLTKPLYSLKIRIPPYAPSTPAGNEKLPVSGKLIPSTSADRLRWASMSIP